jgi:hypothetical protein
MRPECLIGCSGIRTLERFGIGINEASNGVFLEAGRTLGSTRTLITTQ